IDTPCWIAGSVETGKKLHVIPGGRSGTEATQVGHIAHVLALAISTDNKFLASGCRNRTIHIWKPDTCERVHTFSGHKDAVSGLVFRKGTHDLYSASFDRSVKIWNLDEMAYVETLFGHQDHVTGIDALSRERVLTSGGRDGSVRVWKVVEESQLVFHGHSGSIDCVQLINEEHFISGSDDGSVALWSVMKKKPSCLVKRAHSRSDDDADNNNAESTEEAKWIGAVAALHSTDLVASGSCDGYVRLWQCSEGYRSLKLLHKIPVVGFVNALRFASSGDFIVAGVGQEHRLGRWWRRRDARNSVCIVPLKRTSTKQA
ncbi:PREDICTED: U3 small nucleolar RNA-interacting protein 2-like, partial [Priapulus caudatus]|uniref:U3 small nucleolar RNA-interacting protein 2-like n=1 Tax=Priapulus caudatus TaxID=37621 RepID=A0ABM1EXN9_PRICU